MVSEVGHEVGHEVHREVGHEVHRDAPEVPSCVKMVSAGAGVQHDASEEEDLAHEKIRAEGRHRVLEEGDVVRDRTGAGGVGAALVPRA